MLSYPWTNVTPRGTAGRSAPRRPSVSAIPARIAVMFGGAQSQISSTCKAAVRAGFRDETTPKYAEKYLKQPAIYYQYIHCNNSSNTRLKTPVELLYLLLSK